MILYEVAAIALRNSELLDDDERQAHKEMLESLSLAGRVQGAFTKTQPTDTEAKLVKVLLDAPGATSADLTKAMGWDGQAWHLHFGTMCKRREVDLWPADPAVSRDAHFYSGILANYSNDNSGFTAKNELVDVLRQIAA